MREEQQSCSGRERPDVRVNVAVNWKNTELVRQVVDDRDIGADSVQWQCMSIW